MKVLFLSLLAWMLVGWAIIEACRRMRPWRRAPIDVLSVLIWPAVLYYTLKEGPDR